MPMLVLWDVDHTLIETRGVGRAIYERAFRYATGRALVQLAAISGRTELDIIRETLRCNDVRPTAVAVRALADALVTGYEVARHDLAEQGRVLPGVAATLVQLAAEPSIHQSVLTGNLKEVARIKLETFALAEYVDLTTGAYGDDDPDRAALVELARARAHDAMGCSYDGKQTIIIGDTPKDVAAARASGACAIAVATGKSSQADLRDAGADVVVPTLDAHRSITEIVMSQESEGR